MSTKVSFFALAAAGVTAFALIATIFIPADFVWAGTAEPAAGCLCPKASDSPDNADLTSAKQGLDQNDENAALESVQYALTEVADGSSYIWHRSNGRLSGVVKPISSFKDMRGAVCRHAVVVLSALDATKRTEIVACRLPTGIWELAS